MLFSFCCDLRIAQRPERLFQLFTACPAVVEPHNATEARDEKVVYELEDEGIIYSVFKESWLPDFDVVLPAFNEEVPAGSGQRIKLCAFLIH